MADIKLKITTVKEYSCTLSRAELIQILNGAGARFPMAHRLPDDTAISIAVPTGGDYSGDILAIDEVGGLSIQWTERRTS